MEIQEHVPLAPFTTFGIGGPARWFVEAVTENQLIEAVTWAKQRAIPLFILGGGSNLLIADEGFSGLVIHVSLQGIETTAHQLTGQTGQTGPARLFRAAAGESWDNFVSIAVAQNCAGVECLAGIPGTVGGTPVQNVGAYGQEVAETIVSLRVLNLATLSFAEMTAADCQFAYRSSIFNTTARGQFLVTRVDYRLYPGGPANLRYADLQKVFPPDDIPPLAAVAAAVRRIRQAKGMLLVEGDLNCRSAGSFFKNPIISASQLSNLSSRLGAPIPSYPAGEGSVKLPAAWLIEQAGFPKGFRLGPAGISSRHTLALVNLGGATAHDIFRLRDRIVQQVAEKFGVNLVMEPVLVGF